MTQAKRHTKLRMPDDIVSFIRGCHPELKKKIRAGLKRILNEPESEKALKDELSGLQSLRIGRFRIIYRRTNSKIIDIIAIGPRKVIYEETYRILKRESQKNHP